MNDATKKQGHQVWIALQGYGLIGAGVWTWIAYDIPALSLLLIVIGAGAHGWSRELVFRALDVLQIRRNGK